MCNRIGSFAFIGRAPNHQVPFEEQMITAKVLLIQPLRQNRQLAAIVEPIRLSAEKYCPVVAIMIQAASLHTSSEAGVEKARWLAPTPATLQG
jgi:hypothetical protein